MSDAPYTREKLQSLLAGARNEPVRHPVLQISGHLKSLEDMTPDALKRHTELCQVFADFASRFGKLSELVHGRLPAGTIERPSAIDDPMIEGGGKLAHVQYDPERMPGLARMFR